MFLHPSSYESANVSGLVNANDETINDPRRVFPVTFGRRTFNSKKYSPVRRTLLAGFSGVSKQRRVVENVQR